MKVIILPIIINIAIYFLCLLYIFLSKNTLSNWTRHKSLFWITDFEKIKVIYCTGNGFIEIYKNDNFNCLTTCIDADDYEKYKHIFNAEIKYLKGIDENGYLIIQLWNSKKLNKIYKVKNKRRS